MVKEMYIKDGYLDSFFAFRLFNPDSETYLSFIKRFVKLKIFISAEGLDYGISFTKSFELTLEKRYNYVLECLELGKPIVPETLKDDFTKEFINEVEVENVSMKTYHLIDELCITQEDYLEVLASNYNLEKKYTGFSSKDFKNRFLLLPFKYTIGSMTRYAGVFLNVYKNGMAILQISTPFSNYPLEHFSNYGMDFEFDKVELPETLSCIDEKIEISNVAEYYINYLLTLNPNLRGPYEIFNLITLIDYSNKPKSFKENNNLYNELLYKILFAPVTQYSSQDKKVVEERIAERFFMMSKNFGYYVSSMPKIVAVYNQQADEFGHSSWELYVGALNGIMIAIEHSILKKWLTVSFLYKKLNIKMSLPELIRAKLDWLNNDHFFFSRYFFKFGSLKKLLQFIENKCEDFFEQNLVEDKLEKLEELIKLKGDASRDKKTFLIGLVAALLTLFFSLPSIEQAAKFLSSKGYTLVQEYILEIWFSEIAFFIVLFIYIFFDQIKFNLLNIKDKINYGISLANPYVERVIDFMLWK